jgi:RNA polymerase sigma-70 factor (ECF subfamily)
MVTRSRESGRDALQEVFLRYFIARGEGRQIPVPKAWLFRVMRNYLLDLKKASRARSEVPVEQIFETGDHAPDPEMRYCQAELWRRLIRMLAPRELECLRLRGEGLCHGEIAEALSIRPGTVGVLLARSQRKIRKEMERAACGRIVGRVAAPDPYAP